MKFPTGNMTTAEFKAAFKVGDRITWKWATGKCVTITAIGQHRFLFVDDYHGLKECVTKMACYRSGVWRLADERDPAPSYGGAKDGVPYER